MALITCPDCRKRISSLAAACPSCGRPRDADPGAGGSPPAYSPPLGLPTLSRLRRPFLIMLAVVVVLILLIPAEDAGDPLSETATPREPAASPAPPPPMSPAQARVALATRLQEVYASSMLENYDLRFQARGKRCDVLHVEAHGVNLYEQMMESLAYGSVLYGRILPGGVNDAAFKVGFQTVAITNAYDNVSTSFGAKRMSRSQVRREPPCTEATVASLSAADEPKRFVPGGPRYVALSWQNVASGVRLYDGSHRHEATVVSVDRSNGRIIVRYEASGAVEPKILSAVAPYWYVAIDP